MTPVPGEIGILSFSSRKCELRPGLDRTGIRNSLIPVIPGVLHRQHFFLRVRAQPVVQHDIGHHFDSSPMQRCDGFKILRACSIFRRDSALLIKFSQIIRIIHAVADVAFSACPFIGRRQPDAADSQRSPAFRHRGASFPMLLILGQIPLEGLQQRFIFQVNRLLSVIQYAYCTTNQSDES